MKAPQIIFIVLKGLDLLLTAYAHGKPRINQYYDVFSEIIASGILVGLLIWGGFFNSSSIS